MLIEFWRGVPVGARAFLGAIGFMIVAGAAGGLVGHDGIGAVAGLVSYLVLVLRLKRVP